MAYGSIAKYAIGQKERRCRGAYAYDNDKLYFYTSAHCFENRDPFGNVKSKFGIGELTGRIPISPFAGESKALEIRGSNREIFRYKGGNKEYDEAQADVVRIRVQEYQDFSDRYFPVCAGTDESSLGFHAITMAKNSDKIEVSKYSLVEGFVPPALRDLIKAGSPQPFRIARDVEAKPGDSGSPVFLTREGTYQIQYQCLFGILTREVWTMKNSSCTGRNCKMKGEAVFEKIRKNGSDVGRWESW